MQAPAELTVACEQHLARAVLAGDERAYEALKDLLRPAIYNLVRLHLGSRGLAFDYNDVIDDIMTYLAVGLRQTKGGPTRPGFPPLQKWLADTKGSLVGFCLVSVRNYLFDLSRIRTISTEPLPDREASVASYPDEFIIRAFQEDDVFTKELKRAVQDIYERLPPHDRTIIMLKYYLGRSDAEIGRKLEMSETMARKRRKQAEEKFLNLFLNKYGRLA